VLTAAAHAKINLALVVGPLRTDGTHEVATVTDKLELADTVTVAAADALRVRGFADDTLIRAALSSLAARARVEPRLAATVEKRIPVAAGLGGGSSDAATALVLGNSVLGDPCSPLELHEIAAALGADVPLFLERGPLLGTGDGTTLAPLSLPRDYHVVLWLPDGAEKRSTASVYARFDEEGRAAGFAERRQALTDALAGIRTAVDLAAMPPNDLARSSQTARLLGLGAFRADVSGAGPVLYGLFAEGAAASEAAEELGRLGRAWVTSPARDA
jgi:4-diphosphocytidyl-2-C-methyl-D-erythritol kinase